MTKGIKAIIKATCNSFTNMLIIPLLERKVGTTPTSTAWKAATLFLCYERIELAFDKDAQLPFGVFLPECLARRT